MSYDEPPDPPQEDIRTFYGIVDALKPLTDALHQSIGTIGDVQTVAEMAAERIAALASARAVIARMAELMPFFEGHYEPRLYLACATRCKQAAEWLRTNPLNEATDDRLRIESSL